MNFRISSLAGLILSGVLLSCAATEPAAPTVPEQVKILEAVIAKQKQVFSADAEASAMIVGLAELMSAREEVNISDGLSEPDRRRSHHVRVATLIVLTSRQYEVLPQPERQQVDLYAQALMEAIGRADKVKKSKYD
jgi:hypothetical protein